MKGGGRERKGKRVSLNMTMTKLDTTGWIRSMYHFPCLLALFPEAFKTHLAVNRTSEKSAFNRFITFLPSQACARHRFSVKFYDFSDRRRLIWIPQFKFPFLGYLNAIKRNKLLSQVVRRFMCGGISCALKKL